MSSANERWITFISVNKKHSCKKKKPFQEMSNISKRNDQL